MTHRRAIFLDRDGVLNVNRPDHVKTWNEFVFLPGALDALRQIAASDFVVLVMTNQSAIGRGHTSDAAVREIHNRMIAAVESAGGRIDAVYYCPHSPADGCDCRKPKTGMYLQSAREWNIDLSRSYVVGDASADVTAARAIGARAILVLTGRGREQQSILAGNGDLSYDVATDLQDAVQRIWQMESLAT